MLLNDSADPTQTTPMQQPVREPIEDVLDEVPESDDLREALSEYWALKSTSECIQALQTKSSEYYNYCNATGKMALWRLSFEQYNRGFLTLASISRGGLEGELINFPENEFRNIVDHVIGLTLQEKLAFEVQPTNNDYTTNAQVTLADSLLAYYSKHKGMEGSTRATAKNAYLFGEGSVCKLWNENLGDIKMVDAKAQKIYRNGDCTFIELNPTDLIRDIHVKKFKDNSWFNVRLFVNKYDLAAQYPDKAKEIVQRGIAHDWDNTRLTNNNDSKSDLVPLFLFFHRATAALPFGRQTFYIDKDLWLEDGHLKYREIPVYTDMPSPTESINFGYTTAFDLLPLQQILDILNGAIATNNTNFAVSNILVPDGCNLGVTDLIGSMNLLKYTPVNGAEPHALNLTMTPKEVYAFRDWVIQRMEVLAGLNSTIRGQADEKITSGSMAALYASQAIHFNSEFQNTYVTFVGELATGVIHDLQDHPDDKRTGMLAGKANRAYLKEFYGRNVNMIDRVTAKVGSAFAQTDAGKLQIAQDLIGAGLIKDVPEYIEVLKTGSLEPLIEGQHRQLMLIKQENELLAEGQKCTAIMTDDHVTHILEHANVVANPQMRVSQDPQVGVIVTNTLAHINDHIQQLQKINPILAGVLKMPVLNNPAPPPTTPHPPATPPGPEQPGAGGPALRPAPPKAPGGPAARKPAALPRGKVAVNPKMAPRGEVTMPAPAQSPMQPHQGGLH